MDYYCKLSIQKSIKARTQIGLCFVYDYTRNYKTLISSTHDGQMFFPLIFLTPFA